MAQNNPYADEERDAVLKALQAPATVGTVPNWTDAFTKTPTTPPSPPGAPVSTTMPVPDPNKPVTAATTPAPSTAALTGHRDQWSSPFNVTTRGDVGRLSGWDPAKLAGDESTLKYQAGRQFSGFDPTQGVGQLFADPEFTKLFPNAKAVGDDKIDWGFGDLPLDAIQDYGTPNAKWAWQPGEGAGAPASAAGGGTVGGMSPAAAPATATPQSNIQDVIAEITAIANQTKSPMERQALIDALLQQQQPEPVVP